MQVDWLYLDSVPAFIKEVQTSVNGKIRKQRRATSQAVPFFHNFIAYKGFNICSLTNITKSFSYFLPSSKLLPRINEFREKSWNKNGQQKTTL